VTCARTRKKVGQAHEKQVRKTDFGAAERCENPNHTVKRDVAGQKLAFFDGLLGRKQR